MTGRCMAPAPDAEVRVVGRPIGEQHGLNSFKVQRERCLKRGGGAAAARGESVLDAALGLDNMGPELADVGQNVARERLERFGWERKVRLMSE